MPIQEPTPSPHPEHQTFTRTLAGWTFTRSLDTYFTAAEYPGYWAIHLAEVSFLVYRPSNGHRKEPASEVRIAPKRSSDELPEPLRKFLETNDCTNIKWFNRGSTQAVGYLHENNACLVFRGTQQPEDWVVNFNCILYGSTGRHLGFQLAYRAIEREVLAWLKPIQQSYAGIITSGHSLGGALAILSAFELQNQNHRISGVHTFGTPRVGGVDFAVAYRRLLKPVTWRFKWGSDAVTIIPPPPLFIHVCWALNLNFNPSFDLDPISALVAVGQRTAQTLYNAQQQIQKGDSKAKGPYSTVLHEFGPYIWKFALQRNFLELPGAYVNKEPIIACFLFAFMTAVFAASSAPGTLLAAVPIWWSTILGYPIGLAALLAVCLLVIEQLTYFIPGQIFWVLRWLLSIAILAGAAVTIIHFDLFRNGPLCSVFFSMLSSALVWSLIFAFALLRWRQPSVHDHAAKGYIDAFSRPENYSNSNYVYNELGLTYPVCRKVTHQAYDSWLPEVIRDVHPDEHRPQTERDRTNVV